jgi:hypothetical protein
MSFLRAARREVAGAWRSLQYDLRRRRTAADSPAAGFPDVTSVGMSTFGGPTREGVRPRRLVAVGVFGMLALAGAAGSYLAVENGFGGVQRAEADTAQPVPLVVKPERRLPDPAAVPALPRRTRVTPPAPAGPLPPAATVVPRGRHRAAIGLPVRPAPTAPPCRRCPHPPVPTPAPAPYPSGTTSPSPQPSASSPAPDGSPQPTPSSSY